MTKKAKQVKVFSIAEEIKLMKQSVISSEPLYWSPKGHKYMFEYNSINQIDTK